MGQIKGYSHNIFTEEKERVERWLFAEAQKGKRQPAKEKASRLKRKNAYSRLQRVVVAEGKGEVDVDVEE